MLTMAAKYSHHIALTAPLAQYVASQVAKGDYASVSEVVRAGLRLLIEHDEDRARAERGMPPVSPVGQDHERDS